MISDLMELCPSVRVTVTEHYETLTPHLASSDSQVPRVSEVSDYCCTHAV